MTNFGKYHVIVIIILLLATAIPAGQQPVMAGEDGLAEVDLSEMTPKGNPRLDSALNRTSSEHSTPGDIPGMAYSFRVEESGQVIIETAYGRAAIVPLILDNSPEPSSPDIFSTLVAISGL